MLPLHHGVIALLVAICARLSFAALRPRTSNHPRLSGIGNRRINRNCPAHSNKVGGIGGSASRTLRVAAAFLAAARRLRVVAAFRSAIPCFRVATAFLAPAAVRFFVLAAFWADVAAGFLLLCIFDSDLVQA